MVTVVMATVVMAAPWTLVRASCDTVDRVLREHAASRSTPLASGLFRAVLGVRPESPSVRPSVSGIMKCAVQRRVVVRRNYPQTASSLTNGAPGISFSEAQIDNIKTWTGLSVEESIRMTEDRDKRRKYVHGVANPRIEDG